MTGTIQDPMVYIVQTLRFCVYSTVTTSCEQGQDEGYVIGMYEVTITSNLYVRVAVAVVIGVWVWG